MRSKAGSSLDPTSEAYAPATITQYEELVSTAEGYTFLRNSLNGQFRQRRVAILDSSFTIAAITKLTSEVRCSEHTQSHEVQDHGDLSA
jgi:hypothetical protein